MMISAFPGDPEVFVVGDLAVLPSRDAQPVPGVAPAAMQSGRCAARNVIHTIRGEGREHFRYRNKGDLATIGRYRAVGVLAGHQLERVVRVVDVVARAHHVSCGLPKSIERSARVGILVLHLPARIAADHAPIFIPRLSPASRSNRTGDVTRVTARKMLPGQLVRRLSWGIASLKFAINSVVLFLVSVVTQPSVGLDFARIGISGVRLEALFEAVPLAIAVFDAELRLVNANARYRELTGVATLVPARVSIYDAFPNALADLTDHIDLALRGSPAPTAARIPFQHRVGRRLIEATFAPLTEESGGRGLLFAGNDVSEREDLRETLSRNVAQLESIFDVIPDSVRVFDTEGRTVRSNSQALAGSSVGPAVDAARALAARPSAHDRRHESVHARAPNGARAAR